MDLQVSAADSERRFGEGDFPEELNRLNWGAVFLGTLWALIHGVWLWVLLLLGLRIGAIFIVVRLQVLSGFAGPAAAASVVFGVAEWAVLGLFGRHANRLAWSAEAKRLASGRTQPPALVLTVGKFRNKQTALLRLGVLLTLAGYVYGYAQLNSSAPSRLVPAAFGTVCGAAVLAGFWWVESRRGLESSRSS